jgi:putative ubiquitin-RnfH superfamily antitoxin RatB of RatAB toxin-antitoxin module
MENVSLLDIEIAYALPYRQFHCQFEVPLGSTVRDGIVQSQLLLKFTELELESLRVGIFSRLVNLDTPLHAGDRIEVYRPLIFLPTEARRLRAEKS